jgi:MoaA/NifB/PqqE/SkfB family radical SAM enzyme
MGNFKQYGSILYSILRSRFASSRPRPVFLSHLVTEACNGRCPFCFWKYKRQNELTTEEVIDFYRDAASAGVVVNGMWGGEPLLRSDIGKLIHLASRTFPMNVLYTNGWYLEERMEEVAPVDCVFVSIDGVGEIHDRIRGLPGLFDRMTGALEKIRRRFPKIRLLACCTLTTLNQSQILPVCNYAKEMGVDIFFGPLFCADGEGIAARNKEDVKRLELPWDSYSEVFRNIKELKKRGVPISNSPGYCDHIISQKRNYRCHWPRITLTVYSDGGVEDCRSYREIANLRETPLRDIIESQAFRTFIDESHQCNYGCRGQDPVEASKLWDLKPDSVMNYAKMALQFRPGSQRE